MQKSQFWDYFLFGIVYFVQGALSLTAVAMPIFLRDALGLSIPQMTALLAIASTPWVIKPLYGLVSDYYPIRGLRRKPYLLIASIIASFGWFLTAINGTYFSVLLAQLCAALGIAATDVFADGLAVQKSTPATKGKIQSICWGSRSLGAVVTGFFGGWLLNFVGPQMIFAFAAVLPLLTFGVVFFVREETYAPPARSLWALLSDTVRTYARTPLLWWVALFLFLWYVSPSYGTPLFFHLKDTLGFSETVLGILSSTVNFGGVLGAIVFARWLDKVRTRKLLLWLVLLNAALTLLVLGIVNLGTALGVYLVSGVFGIMVLIASMKLIVDVCPKGFEATTFALLAGTTNLASNVIGVWSGGQLYALIGYTPLVLVSAAVGLAPLLFLKRIAKK